MFSILTTDIEKHVVDLEMCIQLISQKDKTALTILYENTKTSVFGYALSILKNYTEAEDTMQETYLKIIENANKYLPKGKPLAWILTITRNIALMKIRKDKKNSIISYDELELFVGNESSNENRENNILLNIALNILSQQEREIVILHAICGFKHRNIASLLKLPLSTVLSKYSRAIKKMKLYFKEEHM